MSSTHVSGRGLAKVLGVNESAVRKAVEFGRIKREIDGRFDLSACRSAWASATDPARSRMRNGAHPDGAQSASAHLRPSWSAPLPQADAGTLWAILAGLPALAAWGAALNGGGLQLAFDLAADIALDVAGDLALRGFAPPPIAFEAVDWSALTEEAGLALTAPADLAADYARRRAEG